MAPAKTPSTDNYGDIKDSQTEGQKGPSCVDVEMITKMPANLSE